MNVQFRNKWQPLNGVVCNVPSKERICACAVKSCSCALKTYQCLKNIYLFILPYYSLKFCECLSLFRSLMTRSETGGDGLTKREAWYKKSKIGPLFRASMHRKV